MATVFMFFFGTLCFITLSVFFFCMTLSARESAKERELKRGKK